MAFRTPVCNLKSALSRLGGRSSPFVTSTAPKSKAYPPTLDLSHAQDTKPRRVKGDMVPVYVALGMVVMSTTLGLHTALHQLKRAPNVQLRKSRRETIPELEDPDRVVEEADQFLKKSVFRKVAHVQDAVGADRIVPDPIQGDVFAREPRAETLKSVGVDPKIH
ncbi:hypothetical protein NMG60_11009773 [Bertholletia excelsa]